MNTNFIFFPTAVLSSFVLTSEMGTNEDYLTKIKHPLEISRLSDTSDEKTNYNYIIENYSIKDIATDLAIVSRGFNEDEAKSYKSFIEEFFI